MNAISIPPIVMAAITLYVGLYHLLIYFRGAHRRHLTFALMCFAMGTYGVLCAGLYNAASLADVTVSVQWQRGQFIVLSLATVTFLWFISDYTGQISKRTLYLVSALPLLNVVVEAVDRSSFTWVLAEPLVREFQFLGLDVMYYEASYGPFANYKSFVELSIAVYILWVVIRYHRRGYRQEARPLFAVMVIFFAAVVNDTAVGAGLYDFIYLIEYGYMGIVLLMTYHLSSAVLEVALVRRALRESEEKYRTLIETMADWVWEMDVDGVYTYVSPSVRDVLGYEPDQVVGKALFDLMPSEEAWRVRERFERVSAAGEPIEALASLHLHTDGHVVDIETNGAPFFDEDGSVQGYRGINRDVTEQKRAEAEREHLQQEIINAQREALQELSTPIIPIMDQIIVLPLIGSIDSLRARDITRALLAGIGEYRAKVVILDITGVPVVDSGVAAHLNKTVQVARLKGARTIITGISDAVAEAIVDLGIDWSQIETLGNLQTGLVAALQSVGLHLTEQGDDTDEPAAIAE